MTVPTLVLKIPPPPSVALLLLMVLSVMVSVAPFTAMPPPCRSESFAEIVLDAIVAVVSLLEMAMPPPSSSASLLVTALFVQGDFAGIHVDAAAKPIGFVLYNDGVDQMEIGICCQNAASIAT